MSESIPIIFNIHVEPDDRVIAFKKKRWLGFENLHQYLMVKRNELQEATGKKVSFNWLFRLDYQIHEVYGDAGWGLKTYNALINEALSEGDEFGVHVHSWKKQKRWFTKTWVADFSDESWIQQNIDLAHKTFINHFDKNPTFFSFGDHYMTERLLDHLEQLGFRADLTVWPGRPKMNRFVKGELSNGMLPSFKDSPQNPYKPSPKNINFAIGCNQRSIWEIPVSVGSSSQINKSYPEKLLLGIPFEIAKSILDENLNRLANPYIFSETRTDVRLDRFNCLQFDKFIDYLAHHNLISQIEIMGVNHFIDLLEV